MYTGATVANIINTNSKLNVSEVPTHSMYEPLQLTDESGLSNLDVMKQLSTIIPIMDSLNLQIRCKPIENNTRCIMTVTEKDENFGRLIVSTDAHEDTRLKHKIGKYVIICDGKNGPIYQSRNEKRTISAWTDDIKQATSFTKKSLATSYVKKLKFNNPRLGIISSEMEVIEIK